MHFPAFRSAFLLPGNRLTVNDHSSSESGFGRPSFVEDTARWNGRMPEPWNKGRAVAETSSP